MVGVHASSSEPLQLQNTAVTGGYICPCTHNDQNTTLELYHHSLEKANSVTLVLVQFEKYAENE